MEIISKDGFGNNVDVNNLFDVILLQNFSKIFFLKIGYKNKKFNLFEDEYLGVNYNNIIVVDKKVFPKVGMLALVIVDSVFVLCRYIEHKGENFFICGKNKNKLRSFFKKNEVSVFGTVISITKN